MFDCEVTHQTRRGILKDSLQGFCCHIDFLWCLPHTRPDEMLSTLHDCWPSLYFSSRGWMDYLGTDSIHFEVKHFDFFSVLWCFALKMYPLMSESTFLPFNVNMWTSFIFASIFLTAFLVPNVPLNTFIPNIQKVQISWNHILFWISKNKRWKVFFLNCTPWKNSSSTFMTHSSPRHFLVK